MSLFLTYKYAVADCKLTLKQNFPDAEISSASILFWIRTCENFIRQRTLKVESTGAYLSEFYGANAIPVITDSIKKWIALPQNIYDLMFEKGIEYISLNMPGVPFGKQIRFTQTDSDRIQRLYYNPYEVPSPGNPYFYRIGNNIYLLGIETVSVANVNLGIYGSLDPRPVLLPLDTPLGINDEQYVSLKDMILSMGRFAMLIPDSRKETGDDDRQQSLKNLAREKPTE